MATTKKPPKKKLPTGPTKADLLSRMGVGKQPELPEGADPPPPAADPLTGSSPLPVQVEEVSSPAPVSRAAWATRALPTELLPPIHSGTGVHQNGTANGHASPPAPLPLPPASAPDPREALDAQLGLQKLTLKWSVERVEKLGSLQNATGLPGEILLEVLLDHWERLPKALQQECLLQAHRIRVERLVVSQNFTIATIEQLLSNC